MTKKISQTQEPEKFLQPERDDNVANIAGYTAGGSPYGITWEEQEEIERRAVGSESSPPPEQKEPVSLDDVVREMQIGSDTMTAYFQRSTGRFFVLTDEYSYAAESDSPLDGHPDWEQEVIRETAEFLAREDDGDYVPLPSKYEIHEYAIIENFCFTVESRKISDDLFRSIAGKGAFRRFKDAVHRHGIEKSWYAFKDEAYQQIAREWCEEHEISWRE